MDADTAQAVRDRAPWFSEEHVLESVMWLGTYCKYPQPYHANDLDRAVRTVNARLASRAADGTRRELRPDTSGQSARRVMWPEWVGPVVGRLRREVFGSDRPPFKDDELEAAEWIREVRAKPERDTDPTKFDAEHQRLRRELNSVLDRLKTLNGRDYQVMLAPVKTLAFYDRTGGQRSGELTVGRLRVMPPLGDEKDPLTRLAELSEQLQRACGVRPEEAVRWVLCGVEPELHPMVIRADPNVVVAGGHPIEAVKVVIEVFTPPTTRELRSIGKAVGELWRDTEQELNPNTVVESEEGVLSVSATSGSRGVARLKDQDWMLLRVLREMDVNESPPDFAALLAKWKELGLPATNARGGPLTPGALRRRYYRLNEKVAPMSRLVGWAENDLDANEIAEIQQIIEADVQDMED